MSNENLLKACKSALDALEDGEYTEEQWEEAVRLCRAAIGEYERKAAAVQGPLPNRAGYCVGPDDK